jgi:TldD protein
MNPSIASRCLELGSSLGASFVELFEEETRSSALSLKNQEVETASAGTEYGVGVRLVYGLEGAAGASGSCEQRYGFTSDSSLESLLALVRALGAREPKETKKISLAPLDFNRSFDAQNFLDPRVLGQSHKLDYLRRANAAARAVDSRVAQVAVSVADSVSDIEIYNSEGLSVSDYRARTRFSVTTTASDGSLRMQAHEAPGALGGFEFLQSISVEDLARASAERALRALSAELIRGGEMPVVIGNGFGGVIFHEACGHPLETEALRRGATPFAGKLGEQVAHPCLTAIDDGTLAGVWGSLALDDEGMPTQRTTLIERGVLRAFMSDRVGAFECGLPRTASARRQNYQFAPVSRMRNTFIAPGDSSVDEMIAGIPSGLYATKMAGGSVNPATGEFNFAVEEGFAIENGKIARPVRGATLIGKGHEILPRISMVGSDLALAAGVCGASSGHVPVTVGQPSIKVDRILVGGG